MLSITEKRFIRYWQEQRTGGRWSYYALYIAIGTLMATIIFSTFLFLFFQTVFGSLSFWLAFACAFLISSTATIISWKSNEKKFKAIIRREMEDGSDKDDD